MPSSSHRSQVPKPRSPLIPSLDFDAEKRFSNHRREHLLLTELRKGLDESQPTQFSPRLNRIKSTIIAFFLLVVGASWQSRTGGRLSPYALNEASQMFPLKFLGEKLESHRHTRQHHHQTLPRTRRHPFEPSLLRRPPKCSLSLMSCAESSTLALPLG